MDSTQLLKVYRTQAAKLYRDSDKARWISALWCSRIVGKYGEFETRGMASDMGVSVDTVEDLAHAYSVFEELGKNGHRALAFGARVLPYVYIGHFRALSDAQNKYKLTIDQVAELLASIVAGEGDISTRDVDMHARERYGDKRDWTWYGQKVMKDLTQLRNQPDLPSEGRELVHNLFSWIGDNV